MKRVRLNQLNRTVRAFLTRLVKSNHVVLEDDTGRVYDLKISKIKQPLESRRARVTLPTWPGNVTGSLHRTDIYDGLV